MVSNPGPASDWMAPPSWSVAASGGTPASAARSTVDRWSVRVRVAPVPAVLPP